MPIIRPAGCASQLPGPGCEVDNCTPSAPSAFALRAGCGCAAGRGRTRAGSRRLAAAACARRCGDEQRRSAARLAAQLRKASGCCQSCITDLATLACWGVALSIDVSSFLLLCPARRPQPESVSALSRHTRGLPSLVHLGGGGRALEQHGAPLDVFKISVSEGTGTRALATVSHTDLAVKGVFWRVMMRRIRRANVMIRFLISSR